MNTFIGCSVIIYDNEGRVLIAQRSKTKKQFPLKWETIGGALEPGDTPEECIRRETILAKATHVRSRIPIAVSKGY